jgi:hypothetical protein
LELHESPWGARRRGERRGKEKRERGSLLGCSWGGAGGAMGAVGEGACPCYCYVLNVKNRKRDGGRRREKKRKRKEKKRKKYGKFSKLENF